jgi:hypothetical protein
VRKTLAGVFVVGISVVGVAGPAAAQPSDDRNRSTVGFCVSDILYGNEPNEDAEGNTVPSQSPGPFVNNPNDPDNPFRGRSVGQFNQDGINITELCRTAFGSGAD